MNGRRRRGGWLAGPGTIALAVLLAACAAGGTPGDDSTTCPSGQSRCGDRCVDTNTDSSHCGACDNTCGEAEICNGTGSCEPGCPEGRTECDGACVNTDNDGTHCGECGNQCDPSETCVAGVCEDDTCSETSSEARTIVLPADIIIAVDNSSSMTDEAGFVQSSVNDFASAIIESGIDARVVLISSDTLDEQGICVPAPLGNGACPNDQNLPVYRHVETSVGSNNALQKIIDTYPEWQPSLRPEATKTLAVITDDDSTLGAVEFTDQLLALDASFEGFKFDAIIAPYDISDSVCTPCATDDCTACDPCCGIDSALGMVCTALPAEEGVAYKALIQQTGGVEGNLCTQDFLPVFQDMATAVINDAQVDCIYDIPEPGDGTNVDHTRVNIEYQPDATSEGIVLPHVPGGAADCGQNHGWYYDGADPPEQLLLCPTTCATVRANMDGKITVKFGCATVVD